MLFSDQYCMSCLHLKYSGYWLPHRDYDSKVSIVSKVSILFDTDEIQGHHITSGLSCISGLIIYHVDCFLARKWVITHIYDGLCTLRICKKAEEPHPYLLWVVRMWHIGDVTGRGPHPYMLWVASPWWADRELFSSYGDCMTFVLWPCLGWLCEHDRLWLLT